MLSLRWQNLMLLAASYLFYGWWDCRFLSLIAFSTIVDYIAGLMMQRAVDEGGPRAQRRKRLWLVVSLCKSLGLLGFFKYYNFFAASLVDLLSTVGMDAGSLRLDIVLPVGISFYLFQTMSYTIDIYRGAVKATRRFFDLALYVAFFPQLVAGPIERASSLLPQILKKRHFDRNQFLDGLHLIFFGLVKKVFVADNLARFVDEVFKPGGDPTGFAVICGVYAFAFQIYCDFSGYSDIARGCGKCMGIELRLNFNIPYLALNPRDFWTRWHISLSTWLRDYLYIPLGGNRRGTLTMYRNLSITMLLGGLWHGAEWNFVLWGAYHGAVLIIHRLLEPALNRLSGAGGRVLGGLWRVARIVFMFHLVCLGWLFFRCRGFLVSRIAELTKRAFCLAGEVDWSLLLPLLKFAAPLVVAEVLQSVLRREGLERPVRGSAWGRCAGYAALFYLLVFYGAAAQSFIYFQF